MLSEITIQNVAVIEKATVQFKEGFTALTGETGAGKSIMIDSINAILGNRTSRDIVRNGASKASIWANFQNVSPLVKQVLEQAGYECDGDLLLQREINTEGKSVCRINGAPATAAILREVCSGLINIHGQHDNQSLLNPAKHIELLDEFAGNAGLLENYKEKFDEFLSIQKQIRDLSMNESEKQRKLDLLRFEWQEIEQANLVDGEEEDLLERRDVARNSQKIQQALNHCHGALNGDDESGGAVQFLADIMREMNDVSRFSQELSRFADVLQESYYSLGELATDISSQLAEFEYAEDSLETLEERLDLLYRLKQKYGSDISQVRAYGERAKQELETIEMSSEKIEELKKKEYTLEQDIIALATELTEIRLSCFEKLNHEIADALHFLNMPGITMKLQHSLVSPSANGQDIMEFYIATNAGEIPKPLAKIASGGELARIMLAIKSALADKDDVPTVIYDEIDTGISGLAAGRVGELMRNTATGRQVICVTHTAQIAAFAQSHLLIEKQVEEGRTFTHIRELDEQQRTQELARIISGDRITDTSLANAKEMLHSLGK